MFAQPRYQARVGLMPTKGLVALCDLVNRTDTTEYWAGITAPSQLVAIPGVPLHPDDHQTLRSSRGAHRRSVSAGSSSRVRVVARPKIFRHITPRHSESELEAALAPIREKLTVLEEENARLRAQLDSR